VFSMDGDRAALVDICDFAAKYGAMIMADEAHATGVFGEEGAGLAAEQGFADRIDIRMGTLSKAVAGVGGFFAGSSMLRDYLVNCSRSLIYSTGLPHSAIAFDLASVRHIRKCKLLGNDLISRANAFREAVQAAGFDTMQSDTQIVPLFIGEAAKAIDCSSYLSKQGIRAPAIRPPTVPKGTARVRLSFHSGLTDESTGKVLDALATWIKGNG